MVYRCSIFSKNVEKLVDIDGTGNNNLANLWILGQPIQVYYNYISDGIYQYGDTVKGGYLKDYLWNKEPMLLIQLIALVKFV